MTPQKIQELATLNLSEVAVQTQDCLAHSTPNVQLEEINSVSSLPNYPAHQRIVQIQQIGNQLQLCLINEQNSAGKASIRNIYEQGFNWNSWLKKSQEKAENQGHPLTGYHFIDYVIQRERYLGESWEEVCQNLC
ncbi:hypothetical protein [Lyngbya sp. PCC 8106]|uniref:hypothetical protein n=1 Tax=Lyngbya sp. (strain PCC 8106) TaxID=313612 RepID=UPI0000EA9B52|nr:hypothetical protein [Lyngbya sp. PCC 8106]EAW35803.1 hypothetical protein L8106_02472 [Lyngbya sp. PCC 8106]